MPAKSAAQFRAMQAAAHGRSTLGIPAAVGKEFVAAGLPRKRGLLATAMRHRARKRQKSY